MPEPLQHLMIQGMLDFISRPAFLVQRVDRALDLAPDEGLEHGHSRLAVAARPAIGADLGRPPAAQR